VENSKWWREIKVIKAAIKQKRKAITKAEALITINVIFCVTSSIRLTGT
jgi:hypothetical protein